MKYLVLITPKDGHAAEEYKPFLIEEEKAVWSAYREGLLREWYIQFAPLVVTFVFESESSGAVSKELTKFPLIKAGLLDYKVIELGPWVQLEMLFDKNLMQSTN